MCCNRPSRHPSINLDLHFSVWVEGLCFATWQYRSDVDQQFTVNRGSKKKAPILKNQGVTYTFGSIQCTLAIYNFVGPSQANPAMACLLHVLETEASRNAAPAPEILPAACQASLTMTTQTWLMSCSVVSRTEPRGLNLNFEGASCMRSH